MWTGRVENRRTNGNHPKKNSIVKIGQNTEMSPGDMSRLYVSENPVKDRQLTLVRETCKKYHNNKDVSCSRCLKFGANMKGIGR